MTWEEELFAVLDDLEQQAEALYAADRDVELADRSRAAYHEVSLASRLMASVDLDLTLDVRGVGAVRGRLERLGTGWLVLRGPRQDWVIRIGALERVRGASERSVPEAAWSPVTRLGLGSALRRVAETGERCVVHLCDGSRHEALLRRIGADFVEATVGEGDGATVALVPFAAVAAVQSRD